jgi:hypothetical protein
MLEPLLRGLPSTAQLLVPNLRGYNTSDHPSDKGEYVIERLVEDLYGLAGSASTGCRPVHLVSGQACASSSSSRGLAPAHASQEVTGACSTRRMLYHLPGLGIKRLFCHPPGGLGQTPACSNGC